jgi:hypothetical protein
MTYCRASINALARATPASFTVYDATATSCYWACVMFTIHGMPNWSTHMPNSSPHI